MVRAKTIEIYSPPRVTVAARRRIDLNVEGGMSFDLKADEKGRRWDFTRLEDRAKVRRRIQQ